MERAAAAPQACAAAISTVVHKVRQKVENGTDLDLSGESSSLNLETLSAYMQGEGRTILDNSLRRFVFAHNLLCAGTRARRLYRPYHHQVV